MMMMIRQQTRLERKMDNYFNAKSNVQNEIELIPIASDDDYNKFKQKLEDGNYKAKVVSRMIEWR